MWWILAATLAVNYAVAVLLALELLQKRREPYGMLASLLGIMFLPVLGPLLYMLLATRRVQRRAQRRRARRRHLTDPIGHAAEQQVAGEATAALAKVPHDLTRIATFTHRLAGTPVLGGNAVTVFNEGEPTYAALQEAMRSAEHHIHLQYFIWRDDPTGAEFRDVLVEKARSGVECRVLLDAAGSWFLRESYLRTLRAAGVDVAFFMPLWRWPGRRRLGLHLRNHRKIAVVDGRMAIVGSQNIGDEYRNRHPTRRPWFDSQVRVVGPAALIAQRTFAEDWSIATRQVLAAPAYFPSPKTAGDAVVQFLPSGPEQGGNILAQLMFAAVTAARKTIRIATPYFAPDPATLTALRHASYRGLDVKLVLPTVTDAPIALWAARSFYWELLDAGLEVYEFDGGMVHSKIVAVDDRWCMVGSANMDARSFQLNFEMSALLYDERFARQQAALVESWCERARRIEPAMLERVSRWRELGEGAARLLTPIL